MSAFPVGMMAAERQFSRWQGVSIVDRQEKYNYQEDSTCASRQMTQHGKQNCSPGPLVNDLGKSDSKTLWLKVTLKFDRKFTQVIFGMLQLGICGMIFWPGTNYGWVFSKFSPTQLSLFTSLFLTLGVTNISGKMTMFQTNLSHSISHIFCRMCPQDILSFLWIHQRHSARIWSGAMIPQYLIILEGHLSDPKKPFWTFSLKYIFLHWGFRKWSNGLFWRWILLIQDQHGRLTFCSHFHW